MLKLVTGLYRLYLGSLISSSSQRDLFSPLTTNKPETPKTNVQTTDAPQSSPPKPSVEESATAIKDVLKYKAAGVLPAPQQQVVTKLLDIAKSSGQLPGADDLKALKAIVAEAHEKLNGGPLPESDEVRNVTKKASKWGINKGFAALFSDRKALVENNKALKGDITTLQNQLKLTGNEGEQFVLKVQIAEKEQTLSTNEAKLTHINDRIADKFANGLSVQTFNRYTGNSDKQKLDDIGKALIDAANHDPHRGLQIARDPNTPPKVLEALCSSSNKETRQEAFRHLPEHYPVKTSTIDTVLGKPVTQAPKDLAIIALGHMADPGRTKWGDGGEQSLMKDLSRHLDAEVRKLVAGNITYTPTEFVEHLTLDKDPHVSAAAQANLKAQGFGNGDYKIRFDKAQKNLEQWSQQLPAEIKTLADLDKFQASLHENSRELEAAIKDMTSLGADRQVDSLIASKAKMTDEVQRLIAAKRPELEARDPNTPLATLKKLADSPDAKVRLAVAEHPNLSDSPMATRRVVNQLLEKLCNDEDPNVHGAAFLRLMSVSPAHDIVAMEARMADHADARVREALASNHNTDVYHLERLSQDKDFAVASAAQKTLSAQLGTDPLNSKANGMSHEEIDRAIKLNLGSYKVHYDLAMNTLREMKGQLPGIKTLEGLKACEATFNKSIETLETANRLSHDITRQQLKGFKQATAETAAIKAELTPQLAAKWLELARDPGTSEDDQRTLARTGSSDVKLALLQNPKLDNEALKILLADTDPLIHQAFTESKYNQETAL